MSRVALADGQVVGAALWNPPDVEFFGDAEITDLVAGATEAFAPGGMDDASDRLRAPLDLDENTKAPQEPVPPASTVVKLVWMGAPVPGS